MSIETRESIELLLHCVHEDKSISQENAMLMYGGLSLLRKYSAATAASHEMNDMFWSLKTRLQQPRIRFIEGDVFSQSRPPSVNGASEYLTVPNITTLNSSSVLVSQARRTYPHHVEQKDLTELGSVVPCSTRRTDGIGSVVHLVCREPGKPKSQDLESCFLKLVNYGEVQIYLIPLFGVEEEANVWADALCAWLAQVATTVELSCNFIDVYYLAEQRKAVRELERRIELGRRIS